MLVKDIQPEVCLPIRTASGQMEIFRLRVLESLNPTIETMAPEFRQVFGCDPQYFPGRLINLRSDTIAGYQMVTAAAEAGILLEQSWHTAETLGIVAKKERVDFSDGMDGGDAAAAACEVLFSRIREYAINRLLREYIPDTDVGRVRQERSELELLRTYLQQAAIRYVRSQNIEVVTDFELGMLYIFNAHSRSLYACVPFQETDCHIGIGGPLLTVPRRPAYTFQTEDLRVREVVVASVGAMVQTLSEHSKYLKLEHKIYEAYANEMLKMAESGRVNLTLKQLWSLEAFRKVHMEGSEAQLYQRLRLAGSDEKCQVISACYRMGITPSEMLLRVTRGAQIRFEAGYETQPPGTATAELATFIVRHAEFLAEKCTANIIDGNGDQIHRNEVYQQIVDMVKLATTIAADAALYTASALPDAPSPFTQTFRKNGLQGVAMMYDLQESPEYKRISMSGLNSYG